MKVSEQTWKWLELQIFFPFLLHSLSCKDMLAYKEEEKKEEIYHYTTWRNLQYIKILQTGFPAPSIVNLTP